MSGSGDLVRSRAETEARLADAAQKHLSDLRLQAEAPRPRSTAFRISEKQVLEAQNEAAAASSAADAAIARAKAAEEFRELRAAQEADETQRREQEVNEAEAAVAATAAEWQQKSDAQQSLRREENSGSGRRNGKIRRRHGEPRRWNMRKSPH